MIMDRVSGSGQLFPFGWPRSIRYCLCQHQRNRSVAALDRIAGTPVDWRDERHGTADRFQRRRTAALTHPAIRRSRACVKPLFRSGSTNKGETAVKTMLMHLAGPSTSIVLTPICLGLVADAGWIAEAYGPAPPRATFCCRSTWRMFLASGGVPVPAGAFNGSQRCFWCRSSTR